MSCPPVERQITVRCSRCARPLSTYTCDHDGRKHVWLEPHECNPRDIEDLRQWAGEHVVAPSSEDIALGRELAEYGVGLTRRRQR